MSTDRVPRILPRLVLGGAGFAYVSHPDPESIPIHEIVRQAFDKGIRAIDTAPFYDPSELLIGKALINPIVTEKYKRSDYKLMTKVGRNGGRSYDFTPDAVRASVLRSLERLNTEYLDVVFCHDIEAVTDQDTLDATEVLLEFVKQGKIKYLGLSSYRIDIVARRALLVREKFGRPVDVVQIWGQMTLQSSKLETEGVPAFKAAGVSHLCCSSPLAIGLLRKDGVPIGKSGDFHPAPPGLREAAQKAADVIDAEGESLAALGLRYTLWRSWQNDQPTLRTSTLTGISSVPQLEENVAAAAKVLGDLNDPELNQAQVESDRPLYKKAQQALGEWVNWQFQSPPKGWSQELKRVVE